MTTPNLISRERAKLNLPNASTSDDRTIDALIGAVSAAIQKYCRRNFTLQRYDELVNGTHADVLILREYPVQSVESVRYSPQSVLEVQNSDTSTNQQARVSVTSSGLELTRTASGTLTRDTTVTWSSNATMAAVASAITTLANGWTARVTSSDFNLYPSQDLWITPATGDANQSHGAFDCRGRYAGLPLHVSELGSYVWDSRGWLYRRDNWDDQGGETWTPSFPWNGPQGHWRVQYSAGFQEVPEDVQEAAAQWIAMLHYQTTRDPHIRQDSSAPSGGTATFKGYGEPEGPPAIVRALLSPYRRRIA